MRITGEKRGSVMVFTLTGRLDYQTSPAIQDELIGQISKAEHRLVLDLSETDYVSSAGLRVLVAVAKRIEQAGGKLVLCALREVVVEVLRVSSFDRLLPVCAARDEAVALAAA